MAWADANPQVEHGELFKGVAEACAMLPTAVVPRARPWVLRVLGTVPPLQRVAVVVGDRIHHLQHGPGPDCGS
jgi:hypothetical protein